MADELPLSHAFLAASGAAGGGPPSAALEAGLSAFHEEGRRAWPALALPAQALAAHLGRVVAPDGGPPERARALGGLRAADLYLACACAARDPAALAAFDREHLARVPGFVAHLDPSPAFADVVQQQCRTTMLFGADGESASIADYGGRGSLGRWVRVAAVRLALNERRRPDERARRALDPEELFAGVPDGDPSPEEAYLRRRYGAELKRSLADAFGALSTEQREVLQLYVGDKLTTVELGRLYGVDHGTVSRWLNKVRALLAQRVRQSLRERLGVGDSDLESLLRLADSKFDGSLPRLLREGKKAD